MVAGDYTIETFQFLDDEIDTKDGESNIGDTSSAHWSTYNGNEDSMGPTYSVSQGPSCQNSPESLILVEPSTSVFVPADQNDQVQSNPSNPNHSPGARPLMEDVVPLEILQG
jgi:hypothetical protein